MSYSEKLSSGLTSLMFLALIIWLVWQFDVFGSDNNITAYAQNYECSNEKSPKCSWKSSYKLNYKLSFEKQIVIRLVDGGEYDSTIDKLTNCVVFNSNNWSCGKGIISFRTGFKDGNFILEDTKDVRFVSKTRWWFDLLT